MPIGCKSLNEGPGQWANRAGVTLASSYHVERDRAVLSCFLPSWLPARFSVGHRPTWSGPLGYPGPRGPTRPMSPGPTGWGSRALIRTPPLPGGAD